MRLSVEGTDIVGVAGNGLMIGDGGLAMGGA